MSFFGVFLSFLFAALAYAVVAAVGLPFIVAIIAFVLVLIVGLKTNAGGLGEKL